MSLLLRDVERLLAKGNAEQTRSVDRAYYSDDSVVCDAALEYQLVTIRRVGCPETVKLPSTADSVAPPEPTMPSVIRRPLFSQLGRGTLW
jgi:hypothetical protein